MHSSSAEVSSSSDSDSGESSDEEIQLLVIAAVEDLVNRLNLSPRPKKSTTVANNYAPIHSSPLSRMELPIHDPGLSPSRITGRRHRHVLSADISMDQPVQPVPAGKFYNQWEEGRKRARKE